MSAQMPNSITKEKSAFKINVKVIIVQEDDYFVAYCPALEVSGYADSIEKAKASFDEEMKIFLSETVKRGTLEKYLLKMGWRLRQIPELNYEPPKIQLDKTSLLFKGNRKIVNQEIYIPVC